MGTVIQSLIGLLMAFTLRARLVAGANDSPEIAISGELGLFSGHLNLRRIEFPSAFGCRHDIFFFSVKISEMLILQHPTMTQAVTQLNFNSPFVCLHFSRHFSFKIDYGEEIRC